MTHLATKALTACLLSAVFCASLARADIDGDWVNADQAGRGLKRVSISKDSQGWLIKAWAPGGGPNGEIPWEPTHLDRLGANVEATDLPYGFASWDFGFKVTHLVARPEKGELVIETFDIFKDHSRRSNYHTIGHFKNAEP